MAKIIAEDVKIWLLIAAFIFINTEVSSAPSDEGLAPALRPNLEYDASDAKDPFGESEEKPEGQSVPEDQQSEDTQKPLPVLNIQGLVWGGRFPQAIINGTVVMVGDTIAGTRIIDISKEGIVVFYNNQRHTLRSPSMINLENMDKKLRGGRYES